MLLFKQFLLFFFFFLVKLSGPDLDMLMRLNFTALE